MRPSRKKSRLLSRVANSRRRPLWYLKTGRPLNYIGSQLLTFLSPFVSIIFSTTAEFDRFTRFLEKRESIPCLIRHIETLENKRHG